MKTSLQHLTACRQTQLREIAGLIKALILPEKIILFGSFASPRNWEPYADTYLPVLPVGYEILVVTRSNDFRPDHSLQDLVEHKCRSGTPTNILVHDIGYVNEQLTQGQPFFFEICRDGILFFD